MYATEDITSLPTQLEVTVNQKLDSVDFSQSEVLQLLKKLDANKSPGPDGIHPRVLKECASELAGPLHILFQTSLSEGSLPTAWKEARVTPIFKKGSRTDVDNYRPVSLTSVCCKVMEKLIRHAVMNHMIINGLLSDYQHGFVQGRSCTTQLLQLVDKISEIIDEGGAVDMVYLDFAKAFDTVPHQRLLLKLESYGIGGEVYAWIQSFLTDRLQQVSVGGMVSSWAHVLSGVPQGSVLGPVLFVCYINDMPDSIGSFIFMYADDTKLGRGVSSDEDREALQADLDRLNDWSRR